MSIFGVFLQRNSISGSYLSCFKDPGNTGILSCRSHHDSPLQPATLFVFAHRVLKMHKVGRRCLNVASFPLKKISHSLVYIWSAGKAREFEQAWLLLISCSTFSIFNPPPLFFLLISPIPFSSQVHLAFIHEFSSALELLGLYLKTSPLNKSSRNLLILPAISPLQSFYSGAGAEERQR